MATPSMNNFLIPSWLFTTFVACQGISFTLPVNMVSDSETKLGPNRISEANFPKHVDNNAIHVASKANTSNHVNLSNPSCTMPPNYLHIDHMASDDTPLLHLPEFNIDPDLVVIAGMSSGADFAIQMQVAYSKTVKGSCAWSGQPFHCGATRFRNDPLTSHHDVNSATSWGSPIDFCKDCPEGQTLYADHCKGWKGASPDVVETDVLVNYTLDMAAEGKIDPVGNLFGRKIYLMHGGHDWIYLNGSLGNNVKYFNDVSTQSVDFRLERLVGSVHEIPPDGPGSCMTFQWPNLLDISPQEPNLVQLRAFNQSEFIDPQMGFNSHGCYYAPEGCQKTSNASPCRLLVMAFGCGSVGRQNIIDSGFLKWADSGRIVMIFPQNGGWSPDTCGFKRWQCFDGYGLTGEDYALQSGPQMSAVWQMMARAVGPTFSN